MVAFSALLRLTAFVAAVALLAAPTTASQSRTATMEFISNTTPAEFAKMLKSGSLPTSSDDSLREVSVREFTGVRLRFNRPRCGMDRIRRDLRCACFQAVTREMSGDFRRRCRSVLDMNVLGGAGRCAMFVRRDRFRIKFLARNLFKQAKMCFSILEDGPSPNAEAEDFYRLLIDFFEADFMFNDFLDPMLAALSSPPSPMPSTATRFVMPETGADVKTARLMNYNHIEESEVESQ